MTTKEVFEVARNGGKVELEKICPDMAVMRKANEDYTKLREEQDIYGDTTGYGERVGHRVPKDKHPEKQRNLVYALNCGSGEPLREDQVRAAMFIRLLVLSKGYSCVRPKILTCISEMLNRGESVPLIPRDGSIGASGDLVPSSYYAIPIMNEIGLEGREGLALVNGTHFMSGISALAIEDFAYLYSVLLKLFAVLFQCHGGIENVFDKELHALKKHPEQQELAEYFRKILEGSKLLTNIDELTKLSSEDLGNRKPIQDRYSLRSLVQELSPIMHYMHDSKKIVDDELNSVSDNPVLVKGKIKHGAHFDGSWIAFAMESLKQCAWKSAYVARAYMRSTTDTKLNHGLLPTYLVAKDDGLNNCLQGLVLGFDADYAILTKSSIPDQIFALNDHEGVNQDTVSMGIHCALSASFMISKLTTLTARLMIITRQTLHLLKIEDQLSPGTQKVSSRLAELIPPIEQDRSLHNELRELEKILFYRKT